METAEYLMAIGLSREEVDEIISVAGEQARDSTEWGVRLVGEVKQHPSMAGRDKQEIHNVLLGIATYFKQVAGA